VYALFEGVDKINLRHLSSEIRIFIHFFADSALIHQVKNPPSWNINPLKNVANFWTEFTAHHSDALIQNGKEPASPNKFVVAATFEKAKI